MGIMRIISHSARRRHSIDSNGSAASTNSSRSSSQQPNGDATTSHAASAQDAQQPYDNTTMNNPHFTTSSPSTHSSHSSSNSPILSPTIAAPLQRTSHSKTYTAAESQQVLRKLDLRLTLLLSTLYLLSFLDRSNIGNARIAGLQSSLHITSAQFDLTLTAFYLTYILFEPMILLYRLIPPHIYISACVFAWGLVACLQASVTSFRQLLGLRALLGVTEAAFGPGVPFYMTFFYRREELAYRVGLQISAAPLATSFASSLAWVILKLSAGSGLEGWRALFLFEGAPSLIAAVVAWHLVPDSPERARWLTPRERRVARLRLVREEEKVAGRGVVGGESKLSVRDLCGTLLDPKAWLAALMFLSVNVSFASLPVFLPTVISDMSFTALTSQILAAPPYLFAFGFVLLVSRASDQIADSRSLFLMASAGLSCGSYAVIAITGFLTQKGVVGPSLSIVARYVAVYGAAMGLFASVVLIITWQLNNQASTTGKGAAMVILNVVGQSGPLIGVKLFPGSDEPYFVKGMAVCAGFMGAVVILAGGLRVYLAKLNGKGDQGKGKYEMIGMVVNRDRDNVDLEHEDWDDGGKGEAGGGSSGSFRYML